LPLRRRIQALFIALFLVLVAQVGIETWAERARSNASRTVSEQLVPARDALAALRTALVDQETGQRGYLLTGQDVFLEPYREGSAATEDALRRMSDLFSGDPDSLAAVDRVRSRVSAWQQLAADFEINAKREGRDEMVTALVGSGTGRQLFERLRNEIDDVEMFFDERLAAQEDRVSSLKTRLDAIRVASVVAALALIALTAKLAIDWVTMPLARLSAAVRRTAEGSLREPIDDAGPPDVGELARDIDAMRRRLLAEVDDAARARAALADRGMIVVTLRDDLAPTDLALPEGLSLAGRFRPAKGLVAGDWYDVVKLTDDRIALALVDVSGHGAEVATFALRTKALTMAAISAHGPGAALSWLSSQLGDTGELFLTGVIIELSASTGEIRYASAGHPPMLLAGLTGVTELPATGPLLGPLPGRWETAGAQLERGGVLLAYSDGLVEARDAQGTQFGLDRLSHVVSQGQLSGVHAVADEAVRAVEAFAVEAGRDDITICALGR
jgi:serine phosphatase RsbU (regulator of sigma subunit)/CHASE3 domain sensor protein